MEEPIVQQKRHVESNTVFSVGTDPLIPAKQFAVRTSNGVLVPMTRPDSEGMGLREARPTLPSVPHYAWQGFLRFDRPPDR